MPHIASGVTRSVQLRKHVDIDWSLAPLRVVLAAALELARTTVTGHLEAPSLDL